jgi:hypothetical protein
MPIEIERQVPSLCIRRVAFEASPLTRAVVDAALELTAEEFRVETDLIVVGPLFGDAATSMIALLEDAGLQYFDDYFELSGNWPEWLTLYAKHSR